MNRRSFTIFLSSFGIIFFSFIVIANINNVLTIVSMLAVSSLVYYFICRTDGLFTGYLDGLNSDVPIAKENIANLIKSSVESIKIVSATFSSHIYFSNTVYEEINNAIGRNVEFDIIIPDKKLDKKKVIPQDANSKKNFIAFWSLVKENKISVCCVLPPPDIHFMIVDNQNIRIEEKHKVDYYPDTQHKKRRARTYYLNKIVTQKYRKKFIGYKETSIPYYSDKRMKN